MHCSYCGTRTKEITKDVTYRLCRNAECRMCEVTEPPNMMGDSPRTYDRELSMERWNELMNEASGNSMGTLFDEISELEENFEVIERKVEETLHRLLIKSIESNNKLKKENKKLKKKIKKLKNKMKIL